jgi:hypothetical protein
MIDYNDLNDTIAEWQKWRKLDHKLINDGLPNKVDASIELCMLENSIDELVNKLRVSVLFNQDVSQDYVHLNSLILQYQQRATMSILKNSD